MTDKLEKVSEEDLQDRSPDPCLLTCQSIMVLTSTMTKRTMKPITSSKSNSFIITVN